MPSCNSDEPLLQDKYLKPTETAGTLHAGSYDNQRFSLTKLNKAGINNRATDELP